MGDGAYENVVGGKLKLKGKALDVKASSAGGITKKKKKKKQIIKDHLHSLSDDGSAPPAGGIKEEVVLSDTPIQSEGEAEVEGAEGKSSGGEKNAASNWDNNLTPAERRYIEQRARIDLHRLAKTANKSHRDRIEDFNQYLANMSEHYDIPKVGPG